MSGVLGTIGLAGLNAVSDNVNNWLQGARNVKNSKRLMDYQSEKQYETQSKLNAMLYPQMVSSMRMAGLNPAMISGPMSAANASAPSASQNMEAPHSDVIGAANAVSNLNLNDSQRELNLAQADALRAEAENKREDTIGKRNINDTYFTRFYADMEQIAANTRGSIANADILEQSLKNVEQELLNLQEINNNLKKQGRMTDEQIKFIEPKALAEIASSWSYATFMSNEDKRAFARNIWEVEAAAVEVGEIASRRDLNKAQEKLAKRAYELSDKYGDAQAIMDMVSDGLSGVGAAAGAFVGGVIGAKGLKSIF